MTTKKPELPPTGPTRPLSRRGPSASVRRMKEGSLSPSLPGSRLSMGGQRLNSPQKDGEAPLSLSLGSRRQSSPHGKRLSVAETQSLLSRKIYSTGSVATNSNSNSSRPLGKSQQNLSRPLPRVRSPTLMRASRTMSFESNTSRERSSTTAMLSKQASTASLPTSPATKPLLPHKPSHLSQVLPPKPPPKPVVFTEEEHNQVNEACKKFCNANKQLLAVSRSVLTKVKSSKEANIQAMKGTLDKQLGDTSEELKSLNTKFSDLIKEANHANDSKKTSNIISLTRDVAHFSSIICDGLKIAAVDSGDESTFKQNLKAITTVKDHLINAVDVFKGFSEQIDASLISDLEQHVKKLSTAHATLVGHKTTGSLIPVGTRMEIEATIRAAVVSIAKLVNSFNGPLEQSIVTEVKVASCCVAQMWATINETINTNTNLLSMPEIREIMIGYAAQIKQSFAEFMEATKQQVANPTETSFEDMKMNERPLRELLRKIVAHIKAYSEIDTSQRTSIIVNNVKPTEKQYKETDAIVSDPTDIVPPPPTQETQSSLDLPDDYVPSAPQIWEEPASDEGRALYTDKGDLRCSTLNKLIIHITANLDMNKMKTFITTYRSFTTPETLLTKVIQRYHVPEDAEVEALPIQLRCCNSLKYLIETQYEDFSSSFIDQLTEFLKELESAPAYQKFATIIKTTLKKKQEERQNTKTEIVNLTIEEKIPLSPGKLLFVINEEIIARQLTLVDFRIYKAIKPAELLNQAWSKPKYKHRAKNVLALVARSTALTMWVASVILWQETLRGRVRAFTKMVNIAQHMYYLNNFNSLMAVLAGISTSAIYRLKFTREQIPAATKQVLEELTDLMDPMQSYSNYRQKLHDVDPPCVPFLGTYLTDITFIEDGNPDYIQGLINYRKRELVYSVIREIQQYQQQSYNFGFVNIAHFLTELASNDEESLYALSLIREPRGATLDQLT